MRKYLETISVVDTKAPGIRLARFLGLSPPLRRSCSRKSSSRCSLNICLINKTVLVPQTTSLATFKNRSRHNFISILAFLDVSSTRDDSENEIPLLNEVRLRFGVISSRNEQARLIVSASSYNLKRRSTTGQTKLKRVRYENGMKAHEPWAERILRELDCVHEHLEEGLEPAELTKV